MVDQIPDLVIFVAAILGALTTTYLKYRENAGPYEDVTGESLPFDKKYVGTAIIAIMGAVVFSVGVFDDTVALVNPEWSYTKMFVVAFGAAMVSNYTINKFTKPKTSVVVAAKDVENGTVEVTKT